MVLSNSQGGRNLEQRPFNLGFSQLILEAAGQKDHTHFWSDVEEHRKCIFLLFYINLVSEFVPPGFWQILVPWLHSPHSDWPLAHCSCLKQYTKVEKLLNFHISSNQSQYVGNFLMFLCKLLVRHFCDCFCHLIILLQ